jgi:hypothetical protein
VALALLCALVWCTLMNRWTTTAWRTTLVYIAGEESSDAPFYFAKVKAAIDGRYWPLLEKKIPELGAPAVATWEDRPEIEQVLIFVTGLIARPRDNFDHFRPYLFFEDHQIQSVLSLIGLSQHGHKKSRNGRAAQCQARARAKISVRAREPKLGDTQRGARPITAPSETFRLIRKRYRICQ